MNYPSTWNFSTTSQPSSGSTHSFHQFVAPQGHAALCHGSPSPSSAAPDFGLSSSSSASPTASITGYGQYPQPTFQPPAAIPPHLISTASTCPPTMTGHVSAIPHAPHLTAPPIPVHHHPFPIQPTLNPTAPPPPVPTATAPLAPPTPPAEPKSSSKAKRSQLAPLVRQLESLVRIAASLLTANTPPQPSQLPPSHDPSMPPPTPTPPTNQPLPPPPTLPPTAHQSSTDTDTIHRPSRRSPRTPLRRRPSTTRRSLSQHGDHHRHRSPSRGRPTDYDRRTRRSRHSPSHSLIDKSRRTPPRHRHRDMPRRSPRPSSPRPSYRETQEWIDHHRNANTPSREHSTRRDEHGQVSHYRATPRPITAYSHGTRPSRNTSDPAPTEPRSRSRPPQHSGITLTPNDAHRRRPSTPPSHTAPNSNQSAPWDAVSTRLPAGDTDESDQDDDQNLGLVPTFTRSDQWLQDYQEAAADPDRPKLPSEIAVPFQVVTTWNKATENQ